MSKLIGALLPDHLFDRLSAARAVAQADRAVIVVSVDERGGPHPAMVSSFELVARDRRRLRLAMPAASRTVRHVAANAHLTLIVAGAEAVHYVKASAVVLPRALDTMPDGALVEAMVHEVLEDAPHGDEQARILTGITLERPPAEATWVAARLADLLA